jgi:hypothetical protein
MIKSSKILRLLAFLVCAVVGLAGCAENAAPQLPRKSVAELAAAVPALLNTLWVGAYAGTGKFSGHAFSYAFVFYKNPGDDTLYAKYADLGPLKVTAQNTKQISYEVREFGLPREVTIISDERGSGYLIAADGNVTFLTTPTGSDLFISRLYAGHDKHVYSVARHMPATQRELEFAKE